MLVSRARLTMQRIGAWVCDIAVPDPTALGAQVTLAMDGGLTLVGTQERGGSWLDTNFVRLAPGANGLKKQCKPKHYRNTSVGVVAKDLLSAAGETLAASSSAALLRTQLPFWTQGQDACGRALTALLQDRRLTAPAWRCLADGTVWIGYETWPDAGLADPGDYQDIAEAPEQGVEVAGFETWVLVPGVSLEGRNVSAVQHDLDGTSVRTRVWFE
jgi:hypothetical protein